VSANVLESTRWEFYYPPFAAALRAGVLSVMCSYNRINDVHGCQNPTTLGDLKDTRGMQFKGWVMSDWLATHSTVDSMKAGLDQVQSTVRYTDILIYRY
jgi:beta-glucosidase